MKRIIALDPGRTTGYALAKIVSPEVKIAYGEREMEHSEFFYFMRRWSADHIVCESFEFRQGKQLGVDLYPCELIGVLHHYATQDQVEPIVFQPASIQGKKAYFSDGLLKANGLYLKGVGHGRSAVKHLLNWLMFGAGSRYAIPLQNVELVDETWLRNGS